MGSGADMLLRVRKNMQMIFLATKRQQLQNHSSDDTESKSDQNSGSEDDQQDSFKCPNFSISDLTFILFGRPSVLLMNLFMGIALLGFMLLFFIFLENSVIGLFFPESIGTPNQFKI